MSKRNKKDRQRRKTRTRKKGKDAAPERDRDDAPSSPATEKPTKAPPESNTEGSKGERETAGTPSCVSGPLPTRDEETEAETLSTEDLPNLRRTWNRHDLWVIVAAMIFLAVGGLVSRKATKPTLREFHLKGLSFSRPEGFLPPTPVRAHTSPVASALADPQAMPDPLSGGTGEPGIDDLLTPKSPIPSAKPATTAPYHVVYQGPTAPLLRLEVRIDSRPFYNNLVGALSLYRAGRYGGSYWASDSRIHNIGGRDWTRTEFRYTHKASETDSPMVATAIEYATLNDDLLYVVTFHGTPEQALELSNLVAPTLSVRAAPPPGESTP